MQHPPSVPSGMPRRASPVRPYPYSGLGPGSAATYWPVPASVPGQPGSRPRFPASPLAGTGLFGDDLYLVAHTERAGKRHLSKRGTGIALAGGLLAELVVSQAIAVRAGGLVCPGSRGPKEPLTGHVWEAVSCESGLRPVADWLTYFARTAEDDVGARLERARYLTQGAWRPGQPRRRPADPDWAFAAVTRANRPSDAYNAVLSGLAIAAGLGFVLEQAAGTSVSQPVGTELPAGLRELMIQIKAAADNALLAPR